MELVVDLGFIDGIAGVQTEALIWTSGGDVISAIEPHNRAVTLGIAPGRGWVLANVATLSDFSTILVHRKALRVSDFRALYGDEC